jgi:hypothetical protein
VDRVVLNAMLLQALKAEISCHRSEPDWHFSEKLIRLDL